jgi:hypothetical protein
MRDDDLDLCHVGDYRGMTTDVANGFIACGCAADRVPLPGGFVQDTRPLTGRALVRVCSASTGRLTVWQGGCTIALPSNSKVISY